MKIGHTNDTEDQGQTVRVIFYYNIFFLWSFVKTKTIYCMILLILIHILNVKHNNNNTSTIYYNKYK